jgi:hypothetical protein
MFLPYNKIYHRNKPFCRHCNEKHDITEQQIEEFQTKYFDVTEQDIEEIKARWWCYDSKETNTKKNTISTL